MRWEKWRIPLSLAPTVAIIIALFGGGLLYGGLQSLGWQPLIGRTELSLRAYASLLTSERYAQQFRTGLLLTVWISVTSTVISAVLAVLAALAIRSIRRGRQLSAFLLQFNLPIPHVVAAIGVLFLLSQSGLLSRLGAHLGLLQRAGDFPILVRDRYGIGIILAYVWKELPFMGVIVLAVLQSLSENYEDSARTLGADVWQRFRYVTLPLIAPALVSSSILVFAFVFGEYQVPEILGVQFPRTLPVLAVRLFLLPDLNARAEAMAMSVLIAAIVILIIAAYRWVADRGAQRSGEA